MLNPDKKEAYIYADVGTAQHARDLIPAELRQALDTEEIEVKTITAESIIDGSWTKSAVLLVIPGGQDIPYHNKLKGQGNKNIRAFVEGGGTYLGFCAGAYYASGDIEFAKGSALQVCESRELKFFPGVAVGPVFGSNLFKYDSDAGAYPAKLTWLESSDGLDEAAVYYNGGCKFIDADKYDNVKILACFSELPESPPAIIECEIGKGKAILSGVHPEYPVNGLTRDSEAREDLYETLQKSEPFRRNLFRKLLSCSGVAAN